MPDLTLLAFDFGLRNIGVAVGQKSTGLSSPLCVLPAKEGKPDWEKVKKLIDEWQPGALLVGLPLNMDDSEGEMCQKARKFAKRLQGRFGLPVQMIDERLSSFAARNSSAQKGRIDAEAASLLILRWLENPELARAP